MKVLTKAKKIKIREKAMNITKSNFYQTMPFILECLKKSHFAAIDYEMTGIMAHPHLRNSNIDSVIFDLSSLKFTNISRRK